jgi:uncharacterized protein (TIGR01777 family)
LYPRHPAFAITSTTRSGIPHPPQRRLPISSSCRYNAAANFVLLIATRGGSMRVLISGSTGLLGTALVDALPRQGHDLARLVRPSTRNPTAGPARSPGVPNLAWDPIGGGLDPAADGADAVVHLAGASIAGGRWTAARKRLLRDSRVAATRHLIDALGQLPRPPKILVAASAIGIYGDRGDEPLTESSSPGHDFLADLCRDWEAEANRAVSFGARVVALRLGVILARHGGALPSMALPFRLGVGGRIGSGRQWMSWLALEDAAGIVGRALTNGAISGPINAVSPQPVRNADFSAALGRALHRPALFPTPRLALRLALGELADALLLSSQRVLPEKLQGLSYPFVYQSLDSAMASVYPA